MKFTIENTPPNYTENKVNKFITEMGTTAFQHAQQTIPVDKGALVREWPDIIDFLPTADKSWWPASGTGSVDIVPGGYLERDWTLNTDDGAQLSISISVTTDQSIEKRLHRLAALGIYTSSMNAYKLGPTDLGHLSITTNSPPEHIRTVYWLNHNVLIHISRSRSTIDVLGIAYKLDQFLNEHIVSNLAEYAPKINQVHVEPETVTINQPFWVRLSPMQAEDKEYLLGPELEMASRDHIDKQGQDILALKFTIDKPGTYDIPLWVGDTRTLLSRRVVATVTVTQPDEEK